jgi:hypothetical protein
MKKIIISLLCLASASVLFAQKGLHIGVIGGPQFAAQLNKEDSDDADVRYDGLTLRAAFGPTVNYHFSDKVGVGTQFLFSYQGLKYTNRANNDYFRKVTYMKIPLLLHVNSAPDKVVGGYFYVGPQFGFLIGKDLEAFELSLKEDVGGVVYNEYSDTHKGVTIGAALGFGMLFNINEGKFQPHIGLRLDGDIVSAYDDEKAAMMPLIFARDASGNRGATRNVAGLIEIGFKYVLFN